MKTEMTMMIAVISLALLAGCGGASKASTLKTVQAVDLGRYLGTWHEIARYPAKFQNGCTASTANYSLREDGKIKVLNTCEKNGKHKEAEGKAWVVDTATNAKLRVSFFWPFAGDYWVIQLDEDYQYVVVGHPDRTYLWILSRTPTMDRATFDAIGKKLVDQGYDPEKLIVDEGAVADAG